MAQNPLSADFLVLQSRTRCACVHPDILGVGRFVLVWQSELCLPHTSAYVCAKNKLTVSPNNCTSHHRVCQRDTHTLQVHRQAFGEPARTGAYLRAETGLATRQAGCVPPPGRA